jgi:hypothetical protein
MTELVSAQNLPRSIRDGIRNLLIAFPAGKPADPSDMVPMISIYAAMVDSFPLAAVERALVELLSNNPRNPFPPTAQDVYERLKSITGLDPKRPAMTKAEWLASETAQICGPRTAEKLWNEKLSPEAKARAALRIVEGGETVVPLRLVGPNENEPS